MFNHPYFLGGGEISFFELLRSLDSGLFQPVVVLPGHGEIETKCRDLNLSTFVIPLPSIKGKGSAQSMRGLRCLLRLVKLCDIDLVHANGSRACLYGGWAGRLGGCPVIWHVRETACDPFVYDGLLGLLARRILCVSRSVGQKRFRRFGGLLREKIEVAYNGIDTERFRPGHANSETWRSVWQVQPDKILFGLVGNIIPRKAQDFFLRGFARARQIYPELSAKVLFFGRALDGEFDRRLRRLVSDCNLQDSVMFHDFSEDIADFLSTLDVFVLCSRSEGFSRSLLEAMACGLPVLASRISEIEEAVADRENAILVEFGDVEKLACGILELAAHRTLRAKLGAANRARAVEKFSLAAHARSIAEVYKAILRRG